MHALQSIQSWQALRSWAILSAAFRPETNTAQVVQLMSGVEVKGFTKEFDIFTTHKVM